MAAGQRDTYWATESQLLPWVAGLVLWPLCQQSCECISAGLLELALCFEGFVQVSMGTHTVSEPLVPVHDECSPQKRVKCPVVPSLSQSLLRLAVTSCSL